MSEPVSASALGRWALAKVKWSNLGRVGKANLTQVLAITPFLAVFLEFVLPVLGSEGTHTRVYFAYLGMILIGISGIIYRLTCPFVILNYRNHLDYVALHNLIIRERFLQIRANLEAKRVDSIHRLAAADAHFIPSGFFDALKAEWSKELVPGSGPEPSAVRRLLLHNYLVEDHSLPVLRCTLTALVVVGAIMVGLPTVATMFSIVLTGSP